MNRPIARQRALTHEPQSQRSDQRGQTQPERTMPYDGVGLAALIVGGFVVLLIGIAIGAAVF